MLPQLRWATANREKERPKSKACILPERKKFVIERGFVFVGRPRERFVTAILAGRNI